MKKISICLALLLVAALALAACSAPASSAAPASTAAPAASTAPAASASTAPAASSAPAASAAPTGDAANNDDLVGPDKGPDYGVGPLGFDFDTLVERMGADTVAGLRIGVSVDTLENEWNIFWANEFEVLAEKYGFEVNVISADSDFAKQANDLRDFQAQQVDGIVIFTGNTAALAQTVTEVYNAGTPIVSAVPMTEGTELSTALSVSQQSKGAAAADALAEDAAGEPRNILLLDLAVDIPVLRERLEGFQAQAANYPNLTIVDERREDEPDAQINVVKEVMLANEDIDTIVATYSVPGLSAYNAIDQMSVEAGVYVLDGDETLLRLIQDGTNVKGTVVQWPRSNAAMCMFALLRAINGDTLPAEIQETDIYALSFSGQEEAAGFLETIYGG